MIREEELREAIAECQGERNPNANTCLKLAAYYTIKDHLFENKPETGYSYAAEPEPIGSVYDSGSEFSNIIKRKSTDEVFSVMDELMNTLEVINPKLYDGVMAKLAL